jgi:nicotinate-nucleotide pyrophosphorylase (carboxylating)
MIKDNHLAGSPDIIHTVAKAKKENPDKDIQLEVDTQEQLEFALKSDATSLLLDNFKPDALPNVIEHIRSHSKGEKMYIELSGGITAETLSNFCIKGVNGISMGALTHNITSKDIGLDII